MIFFFILVVRNVLQPQDKLKKCSEQTWASDTHFMSSYGTQIFETREEAQAHSEQGTKRPGVSA